MPNRAIASAWAIRGIGSPTSIPAAREHVRHQPLVGLDHVLDLDERHLDVELGEVGLAVGAQVLVAEAAGDLVVALEPGHHQELLEELRRLRQRVEGALLEAARDEEVAGALGCRAGQDRRLDLDEAVAVELLAHRRDELRAGAAALRCIGSRRRSR